jgi:hypothetical protein
LALELEVLRTAVEPELVAGLVATGVEATGGAAVLEAVAATDWDAPMSLGVVGVTGGVLRWVR